MDLIDRLIGSPSAVAKSYRFTWNLTDHVCRECMGRILVAKKGKKTYFQCADCGRQGANEVKTVCACGARLTNGESAGMHCSRNDNKHDYEPEVVVIYDGE